MPAIRPGAAAALARWREAGAGGAAVAGGLWLAAAGGWPALAAGAAVALGGALWTQAALRRMRFARAITAPGVIEVDEGRIGYLGPSGGGFVALPEVVELRLVALAGRRFWRLRQADGQALLLPVDAAGAARLYDAFASLPGLDMAPLVAALAEDPPPHHADSASRILWRRPGAAPRIAG